MAAPEASIPVVEGPLAASLLSEARTRKFDLLLHLAVNLAQPIVVSGPEGMGKTVFLRRLETSARPFAAPCYLAATAATSYEAIVEYLRQAALRELGSSGTADLGFAELMAHYARERRLLILMLDNADLLLPGLLSALWDLARQNPALHLVLALPSQSWARKFATDAPALRDAQPLEVPSLTPAEFAAFLKRLAADQPEQAAGCTLAESWRGVALPGVPGAALRLLDPSASSAIAGSAPKPLRWRWIGGGAAVLALALGAAWLWWRPQPGPRPPIARSHWSSPGADVNPGAALVLREPAAPAVPPSPQVEAVGHAPPVTAPAESALADAATAQAPLAPGLPSHQEPPPQPVVAVSSVPAPTPPHQAPMPSPVEPAAKPEAAPPPAPSVSPLPPANPSEPLPEVKALVPATPEPAAVPASGPSLTPEQQARVQAAAVAIEGVQGVEWVLTQSPDAYTLQVVAMSQARGLAEAAKRFPAGSVLAALRARKGRGDLYTLFYGVYPGLAEAKEGAKSLPPGMGTPIPRPFKAVQGEVLRPPTPSPAVASPLRVPHPARQP
jgi:DamX protein